MNRRSQLAKLCMLGALSIFLLSCETVGYYTQAARGQLSIMTGREDIERLLADDSVPAELKEKLELVLAVRQFAESEMQLPVENNYSTFVDVGREHVVWNVFAAPEFSTEAINWCYPIAGCVSYRGYFSESAASNYAQRLTEEGYDVYTGGVDAYSTLGWFDDSLLSTVINRQDYQLAGLIFHELAHQVLYVQGDTTFNESFATAVEREGVRRWLESNGQEEFVATADSALSRQQEFVDLVIAWREKFTELYSKDLDAGEMRNQKQNLQKQMRADYEQVKESWDGYAGYDSWFARSLNNAQLSTVASYNSLVPHFNALLATVEGDMSAFFQKVREIAVLSEEQRAQRLNELCEAC
ncbi:MAG: aminopeptidase [Pseudomonadales bacterium]|nr:aminopeptidase [Pseudomonadales bacterium]